MRKRHRLSSGQLLLLEIVFAVTFFCIAVAVTMSIFGRAYEMSSYARAKKEAVLETDNTSEIIRSCEDKEEIDERLTDYGFEYTDNGVYIKHYGDGRYRIMIVPELKKESRIYSANITNYIEKELDDNPNAESVFSVIVDHVIDEGGAENE